MSHVIIRAKATIARAHGVGREGSRTGSRAHPTNAHKTHSCVLEYHILRMSYDIVHVRSLCIVDCKYEHHLLTVHIRNDAGTKA